MREILFRGKTSAGEWVFGFYTLYANNRGLHSCILTGTEQGCVIPKFVIPETVGQYTGLTDKNGKKIFEGDILRDIDGGIQTAIFDRGAFCGRYVGYTFNDNEFYINEVVGNIHDNPELLNVEREDG